MIFARNVKNKLPDSPGNKIFTFIFEPFILKAGKSIFEKNEDNDKYI